MDPKKREELLMEWKRRKPSKGIICIICIDTGDTFLAYSNDTKADINSNVFKLRARAHSNRNMSVLWERYGEGGFVFSVISELEYDNPNDDHSDALSKLLDECLLEIPNSTRIRVERSKGTLNG